MRVLLGFVKLCNIMQYYVVCKGLTAEPHRRRDQPRRGILGRRELTFLRGNSQLPEEKAMIRMLLVALLALCLAAPALADVTVKQTTSGKGLGISGKTTGTVYIKGNKMRSDSVMGDRTQTTIFDVDAQKMYIFDSKKKEADVWDMSAFAAEVSKSVDVSSAKASFKPNGQTKEIGGQTAAGYEMEISMQAGMGGNKDMPMTVTLQGPVWIVKNAPGAADYNHFYKTAVERGWIFTEPRAAKAQPGQAKALAEMYRQVADVGGIPYETELQIRMGGSGPMGGLFAKLGNVSLTTVVDGVETGSLPDDLFAPPAGYKLNTRK